jgi:hypothetical protein
MGMCFELGQREEIGPKINKKSVIPELPEKHGKAPK